MKYAFSVAALTGALTISPASATIRIAGDAGGQIGVMRFADGKWKEAWYFADELGLMLQLNALHMLEV